jgi:CRP/FNR family cyclic AMP-dependent transcriptional regulator
MRPENSPASKYTALVRAGQWFQAVPVQLQEQLLALATVRRLAQGTRLLPRTHDAWAEGESVVLHIPRQGLAALLDTHPAYWRHLGLLLTHKLRTAFSVLEETALLPAAGRLTRRLVTMAEGYGEWKSNTRRVIHVPQEQLGQMLSLSRQTVNQLLKQLEAQGAIRLTRGGIEILDIDRLRTLAT